MARNGGKGEGEKLRRLPPGRHGLSREFVAQNQRERLIAGLTQALYEVGYQKTTVSLIGRHAAVSKSDFYKHFESKDECFVAAYDVAVERIRDRLVASCQEADGEEWPQRVRNAIKALLELFEDEPALASQMEMPSITTAAADPPIATFCF